MQNRINLAWIEQQKAWHEDVEMINQQRSDETLKIERDVLALHQRNFEQEDAHREKMRQNQEAQSLEMSEQYIKAYETWIHSFGKHEGEA